MSPPRLGRPTQGPPVALLRPSGTQRGETSRENRSQTRAAFLREPDEPFFLPDRRGRRRPRPGPDRDARIIRLRKERNLSAAEIADLLTRDEGIPVSETTVARVIRQAGLPKL